MPTSLPNGANLQNMRKQARRLQRGVRSGDPAALDLLREHDPAGQPAATEDYRLTSAQLVVARAYGLPSWPRLVAYLTAAGPHRSDPTLTGEPHETAADTFARLACLSWTGDDDPAQRATARGLLARRPELVDESVWAAAAATDPDAIGRHLARDGALADTRGGPHGWTPLLHLTFSRCEPDVPWSRVEAAAGLLLDAGADPDAGFLWQGLVPPFTVLTGVFGEGEQGPVNQPRHPHAIRLARLLLAAGADPNDGQSLYNRMFRPDDDHLVVLLEHGLGRDADGPWRQRLGDVVATGPELLREQLGWAVERGFAERVRLLLAHGGMSLDTQADATLVAQALSRGDVEIVDALVSAGAPAPRLDAVDALLAAVSRADDDAVAVAVETDPGLAARARARRPDLVLAVRRPASVALLTRLGFDLDTLGEGTRTALHEAAFADDLALVRALVEAGADRGVTDTSHGGTPLRWARFAHAERVAAYLASLDDPLGRGSA